LKNLETRQDPAARLGWKIRLIRGLYERGLTEDEVRQLFRLIDWMMDLPEAWDQEFDQTLARIEEEKKMPYITSIERLALKRGKAEGKVEALIQVLGRRFPTPVSADLDTTIRATTDLAQLERWMDLAVQATSLEEFRRLAGV
jgi:hypothetical protein